MNKFDIVKIINEKPYLNSNLEVNARGIVIDIYLNSVDVLFFNSKIMGDYAIINVSIQDLITEKEKLPVDIQNEIRSKLDIDMLKGKDKLEVVTIGEYDIVELLIEDSKYTKYGIHKGDRGVIVDNKAIRDYIEVDFSGVDENGNYYGDCISVKINDLKVIK